MGRSPRPTKSGRRTPPRRPRTSGSVVRRIPFYRQTAEFSCGPASVAMAYAFFRTRARLDRDLEFHLWRDTHLPLLYGANRFGIAVAAERNGLGAHIISACKDLGFAETASRIIHIPERGMKFFGIAQWRTAARLGVTEEPRDPGVEDLESVLHAGGVPILFVSTRVFDDDDIPHWIVVSGIEQNGAEVSIRVNNPLDSRSRSLPASKVMDGAEFFGERGLVAVFRDAESARKFARKRPRSRRVVPPKLPGWYFGPGDMEFRSVPGVRIPGIRPSLMDEGEAFKRKARARGRRRARKILEMWAGQSP